MKILFTTILAILFVCTLFACASDNNIQNASTEIPPPTQDDAITPSPTATQASVDNLPATEYEVIRFGTDEASLPVPEGWSVIREEGTDIPQTEETQDIRLTPQSNEKALAIITIGKTVGGERLSDEDFYLWYSTRVESALPHAVEENADYIEVKLNDGNGVYAVLTDASLVGTTPGLDEYIYLVWFFANYNGGYLVYASLLTDNLESESFKEMLNTVTGINVMEW